MTPDQYRAYRDQALQRWLRGEIGKAEYDDLDAKIRELEASSAQSETPTPAYEPGEDTRGGVTVPRLAVPPRLQPGDLIEKYRLESMQRGGMGEVWKAWDTKGDRYVALKFLPPELSGNEDEIARIRATFKLVEQLDHPHICRVFDLNEHPRWGWYQVMRWIEGQTLSQYHREVVGVGQPLPWETVVKLLWPAARALDFAHERKVLHRDIKPQNLMRDSAGQVVVIDFGLAAEVRSSLMRVSRKDGHVAGTPPYLAPEQWDGESATPKTDQYALGVTAYELLSGRWPFEREDTEILARVVKSKPVAAIDGVSDGVLAVLRTALAKQPGERFPNCREFVQRLAKQGETARPIVSAVPPLSQPQLHAQLQGLKAGEVRTFSDHGIKFCWCPAGEFLMGSTSSDSEAYGDENPQHRVRLTGGFWLGQTEVTQNQWQAPMSSKLTRFKAIFDWLMGSNPSSIQGRQKPVGSVSWEEAEEYCRKLTAAEQASGRLPTGWSYRLPTEAEWEYACRAGTTTRYSFGDEETQMSDFAWFRENSVGETHPVGQKRPNAWGLFDMHGNVWEWCADWYADDYYRLRPVDDPAGPSQGTDRVSRGGSWGSTTRYCRSAYRGRNVPSYRGDNQGFRLVLSPSVRSPEAR